MGEVNVSKVEQPVADEEELVVGSDVMYSLLFGFVGSFVLRTAVVLGLPDIIARAGPDETLALNQIAAQLNSKFVNEFELQTVLSALVTRKIFRCTKVGTTLELQYRLTPASKLLVTDNPHNQAPVVLFQTDPASQAPWQPDSWKYFNDNPGLSKCFNDAMASGTTVELIAVRKYEGFKDIKTLVDVGGGIGRAVETIISSYPHIHGINYDLPHVIADAPTIPGNQDFFHAKLILCISQQSNNF
ncbi:unnamed protein product [Sphagnum troendelagicum]|uniref:O-methyltransferase n=1 Tax=Sphagnum troendelagicum TaxID=128251 RepID=A0ABP0T7C0_9BRYO